MELELVAQRPGRLSSFLKGELKMSTGLMNRLKWGDALRVNGTPQRTNYPVQSGDVITVQLDEPIPAYPAQQGPLTVLYEDAYLLAVDKPAGMLIHPSHCKNEGTLANFVCGYYAATGQNSAFHPLTRLDRDTFGVVLLAKNSHIHSLLQQLPVKKTYLARTYGGPAEDEGMIDAPIARREKPSLLRCISPEGKKAVTLFRVLQRRGETALLALQPVTGRTHQLRLHCAHSGFPILGDPQYASAASVEYSLQLGLTSQQLCAYRLELPHPITGQQLCITTQLAIQ